ncbi:putative membrane protein [Methanobacterium sp. MB1]|nr:putative membrane protein [Methanobacterium sp. MB1]
MIFLKLVLAGHLTMFATRVKGPFWSLRPKGIFFWSIILTDITATLFVISGIIMPIVSWELVAFIWLYALVAFIAGDILKIRFYRFLERINLS